ncbi:ABC transporter [Gracilibacillus boraciitolerans JCM 21714]|uniref:ABC transporter n=1 Tax=Gracilibacillus boraciitolerans JCM 21714 TaxID=1298598 RepID=W4VIR7_9BACI|nr:ABC transporter [Gracilibacillus boraciitolerans JCM 21714]
MESVISVKNLTKTYKKVDAVKGISFDVKEGEIFGFLGPNGAGKSTTINMICTMLKPTSGEIMINGIMQTTKKTRFVEVLALYFKRILWMKS